MIITGGGGGNWILFPYFKSFRSVLKRKNFVNSELPLETSDVEYSQSEQEGWDRLESSKGHINIKSRM